MSALLSIENLRVALKDPARENAGWILRGISLTLREKERLALVGESGCGKSMTALSVLNLLPKPPMEWVEGEIRYRDRGLRGLPEEEWRGIRGKEIGIVFQEPFSSLNPVLRVGEQIEEMIRAHSDLAPEAVRQKARALLKDVGLPDPERVAAQYPHQLSGGMCQRVMIAMALACAPSLLIADEPTTALDVTVQTQILDLLFRMTEENQMAVLFITHDLRIVKGHADRVAILYAGQVVEEGKPSRIFDHPQHPYTEGLLEALPEFSHKGKPLFNIKGSVPSPYQPIQGCAFADRCLRAQEKCRSQEPALETVQEGHFARCFYPSKK